jgi:hypothetical protein
VRPVVAVVLTLIGFFAVVIAVFGLVSLWADAEVVPVAGAGSIPGVVGVAASGAAYAAATSRALDAGRRRYRSAIAVGLLAWLAYGAAAGLATVVGTGEIVRGLAVAGALLVGWPGVVVGLAAAVASWCAVALVRTRAGRPRWPWEGDDE